MRWKAINRSTSLWELNLRYQIDFCSESIDFEHQKYFVTDFFKILPKIQNCYFLSKTETFEAILKLIHLFYHLFGSKVSIFLKFDAILDLEVAQKFRKFPGNSRIFFPGMGICLKKISREFPGIFFPGLRPSKKW